MTSCHEENLWFLCWSSWIDSWASIVCQTLLSRVWISPTRAGVLSSYLSSMHLFFHLRWCCVIGRLLGEGLQGGRSYWWCQILWSCVVRYRYISSSYPLHATLNHAPCPPQPPLFIDNRRIDDFLSALTTCRQMEYLLKLQPCLCRPWLCHLATMVMSPGNRGYVTWLPWLHWLCQRLSASSTCQIPHSPPLLPNKSIVLYLNFCEVIMSVLKVVLSQHVAACR